MTAQILQRQRAVWFVDHMEQVDARKTRLAIGGDFVIQADALQQHVSGTQSGSDGRTRMAVFIVIAAQK